MGQVLDGAEMVSKAYCKTGGFPSAIRLASNDDIN